MPQVHNVSESNGFFSVRSRMSARKLIGGPGMMGRKQPRIPRIVQMTPITIKSISIVEGFDQY